MNPSEQDDYKKTYDEFWKNIVENEDGTLNKDAVMRELHDYNFLLDSVPKVYCAITDSRISYANTLPDVVISVYEECLERYCDEAVKDYILGDQENLKCY